MRDRPWKRPPDAWSSSATTGRRCRPTLKQRSRESRTTHRETAFVRSRRSNGSMRVSVFGLGYVGSVSAASFAADGHTVVGVDVNPDKVASLNEGRSPIVEKGLDELIQTAVANGSLRATTSTDEAVHGTDLSLLCVGTPSRKNGSLDLSYLERVCEQ